MNASIYAFGTEFLRGSDSNLLFDGRCDIVVMPDTGILDIDCENDFVLMEVLGEYLLKNDRDYGEIAQAARRKG
jgi:CMP-N,N'-diacetyllegionaminic acid synthase